MRQNNPFHLTASSFGAFRLTYICTWTDFTAQNLNLRPTVFKLYFCRPSFKKTKKKKVKQKSSSQLCTFDFDTPISTVIKPASLSSAVDCASFWAPHVISLQPTAHRHLPVLNSTAAVISLSLSWSWPLYYR